MCFTFGKRFDMTWFDFIKFEFAYVTVGISVTDEQQLGITVQILIWHFYES